MDFARLGFQERRDVHEWVAANPSILGDNLLIIGKGTAQAASPTATGTPYAPASPRTARARAPARPGPSCAVPPATTASTPSRTWISTETAPTTIHGTSAEASDTRRSGPQAATSRAVLAIRFMGRVTSPPQSRQKRAYFTYRGFGEGQNRPFVDLRPRFSQARRHLKTKCDLCLWRHRPSDLPSIGGACDLAPARDNNANLNSLGRFEWLSTRCRRTRRS